MPVLKNKFRTSADEARAIVHRVDVDVLRMPTDTEFVGFFVVRHGIGKGKPRAHEKACVLNDWDHLEGTFCASARPFFVLVTVLTRFAGGRQCPPRPSSAF